MTNILKLVEDTNTIDFILSSSDYTLLADQLQINLPEVRRVIGGDPLLGEGERLVDRQYSNREIEIGFKIEAADHNALVSDIRAITRMIDLAKKKSKEIHGANVELRYKLDNATDEVVFDVLDGDFDLGRISSSTVRRASILLDCKLTLICQPFARLDTPIKVSNFLVNPGFEWNPGEGGRDAGKTIDLGASGTRLINTGGASLSGTGTPVAFSAGIWVEQDTAPASVQTIMICGNTTTSWKVELNSSQKVVFTWTDVAAADHVITSSSAISLNTPTFISVAMFTVNGTDLIAVLMIDDKVEGFIRIASGSGRDMRVPVGELAIGSRSDNTLRFDGKIAGGFIVTGKQILPYQLVYVYYYGIKGLVSSSSIMSPNYWGLEAADFGAVWPFDESSGPILDKSGNGRDLTVVGSPTITSQIAKPNGWTIGTDLDSSTASGLISTDPKHGLFSLLFKEATPTATKHISQTVNMPTGEVDSTIILWVKSKGGANKKIRVKYDTDDNEITAGAQDVWRQFIKTSSIVSGTFQIGWFSPSTGSTDIEIDSVMVLPGKPFGTFASFTDVTDNPKVFVGARDIRAFPDSSKVFWVDIYDVPGDVPATSRVMLKNTESEGKGPIRIGALFGREPWKQFLFWRASQFIPDFANGSSYGSTPPDIRVITAAADITVTDRFFASLPRLYPFPDKQLGSFKAYIGSASQKDITSFLRRKTLTTTVPLTGDPVKDISTEQSLISHMMDGGILSWPPEIALSNLQSGRVTSRGRVKLDGLTPKLVISNITDTAIAAPLVVYEFLYLLPIEGGYFMFAPTSSSDEDALLQNETLVIDTIDQISLGAGYIVRDLTTPDGSTSVKRTLLTSSDMSLFGTGFKLEPNQPGLIAVLFVDKPDDQLAGDEPFGNFLENRNLEVSFEIMPRFLYV